MTFGGAVNTCLKQKYAIFAGRARRSEYWWFTLFVVLVQIVGCGLVMILASVADFLGIFAMMALVVVYVGLIVPGIAVLVRRLHDTGRTGWWFWIMLVPMIGPIVLLVFLCLCGTEGDNAYGPDPLVGHTV